MSSANFELISNNQQLRSVSVFNRLTARLDNVTISSQDLIANISVITDAVAQIKHSVWKVARRSQVQPQYFGHIHVFIAQ